jgi:cytochrome c oxidase subunit 2
MQSDPKKPDTIFIFLLIMIIVGLPFGIWAYDYLVKSEQTPLDAKEFILTGSVQRGWLLGEVQAHDIVSIGQKKTLAEYPVIEVSRGDDVVLKLRSSDVTHGFALKAYDIYIPEGIKPGKTVFVSFKADKTGTFSFWCNVYCGDIHQHMKGTLIVKD